MHQWISTGGWESDIKPSVVYSKGTWSRLTTMDIESIWRLIYPITDKNSLEIMDGHFSLSGRVGITLTYQTDKSKVSQNGCVRSRMFLPHGWCCRHKPVFWVSFIFRSITEVVTHCTILPHLFEADFATNVLSNCIFNRNYSFWKF